MKKIDNSFHDYNTDSHILLQNDANENQVNNTIDICDKSEQENIKNNK